MLKKESVKTADDSAFELNAPGRAIAHGVQRIHALLTAMIARARRGLVSYDEIQAFQAVQNREPSLLQSATLLLQIPSSRAHLGCESRSSEYRVATAPPR